MINKNVVCLSVDNLFSLISILIYLNENFTVHNLNVMYRIALRFHFLEILRGESMQKGVVKFFNNSKGFGFIAPEDGSKDVFVHISALQKCGIDTLNENDAVEFTLEEYKGREGVGEIKLV